MHAGAVPVALHRLGLDRDLDAVILGQTEEEVAGDPQVVADGDGVGRADLEFPLAGHDFGVGAGDGKASLNAGGGVLFDEVTAVDLHGTDTAVVRALRSGETAGGEAGRPTRDRVEEGVLLLETEPGLLVAVLLHCLDGGGAGVGGVRRHVAGQQRLAEHEDVVATADRVRALEDRLQDDVGIVAGGLVGAGAVVAPDPGLSAISEDLGLGADLTSRLGAVDPQIFSPVGHVGFPCVLGRGDVGWVRSDVTSALTIPMHSGFVGLAGPARWATRALPGEERSTRQFRTCCSIVNGV